MNQLLIKNAKYLETSGRNIPPAHMTAIDFVIQLAIYDGRQRRLGQLWLDDQNDAKMMRALVAESRKEA